MGKFILTRTLKLDDVDDSWKGCYITMREPVFEEVMKLSGPISQSDTTKQIEITIKTFSFNKTIV